MWSRMEILTMNVYKLNEQPFKLVRTFKTRKGTQVRVYEQDKNFTNVKSKSNKVDNYNPIGG